MCPSCNHEECADCAHVCDHFVGCCQCGAVAGTFQWIEKITLNDLQRRRPSCFRLGALKVGTA